MQPSPIGTIVAWSGAIVDIPSGWALCNGANGTPDLRDKFIVGAGNTYSPADTGGAANHQHTFTGIGHPHAIPAGTDILEAFGISGEANIKQSTGTTDNGSSLPPYYSLAYIMFLGA